MGFTNGACVVLSTFLPPLLQNIAQVYNASHFVAMDVQQRARSTLLNMVKATGGEFDYCADGLIMITVPATAPSVPFRNNGVKAVQADILLGY